MRNMSFMLTTEQYEDESKDVTRRLGWWFLKRGEQFMGCEKCQGLKKGENINRLHPSQTISSHPEPLNLMITDIEYGKREVIREGFPNMTPQEFVDMFCKHNKCKPSITINRIEFKHLKTKP